MIERRSITVDADVHRSILGFRSFLLNQGVDLDYTHAINFLARHGFDEIRKSGLSPALLDRLGEQVELDEATRKKLTREWPGWKVSSLEAGNKMVAEKGIQHRAQALPTTKSESKPVFGWCPKCQHDRRIVGAH